MHPNPQPKQISHYPRVKIYYLKNDPTAKNPPPHYTSPITAPSITSLSSFLQKQKNHLAIGAHERFWPASNLEQPEFTEPIEAPTISFTQPTSVLRHAQDLNRPHISQQAAHINDLKTPSSPIRSNTFHVSSPDEKRFIKTSQEKYFQSHQNNEALSKDFLCNIVKEWNHFTERQRNYLKKSVLNKRKRSIDHQKIYRPQEIQELKKNKSLMKQHFNLFLQNQKVKSTKKKEKSATLLKAIFHRQDSSNSMVNKNLETPEMDFSDFKTSKQESVPRSRTTSKTQSSDRRLSVSQQNPKKKYFRLLYGPEIKLIPRLFQQKSKIRNFDWTKLDRKTYEAQRKNLDSLKLFQD